MTLALRRSPRAPTRGPSGGGVADSLDEAKAAFRGGGGASGIAGKSRREMLSLSPPTRTAVATPPFGPCDGSRELRRRVGIIEVPAVPRR